MAEDSDQERTEEPTQKRLTDARRQGQIPRSRELGTLLVLLTGAVAISMFKGMMAQGLWDTMTGDFRLDRGDLFDPEAPLGHLTRDFWTAGKILMPVLALCVLAALISPLGLGGWNFTTENLMPKLERLSPIQGLGRMVSAQALAEALKAVLKVALVGLMTAGLFLHYQDQLLNLPRQPLLPAAVHALDIIMACTVWLSASLLLVAAVDVPFQLWSHKRKLRMSRQELKDEYRDTEGKPEVKSRIRGLQMEMSRRRMMEAVPTADVVVTNPSHFAVALKYDQNQMSAPRVVAKGTDLIAAQIRNLAIGAKIPLLAAPSLARALYYSTDIDKEIPAGLYLAVAQVLAYVYQLKAARLYGGDIPVAPSDFKVPEEFLRD